MSATKAEIADYNEFRWRCIAKKYGISLHRAKSEYAPVSELPAEVIKMMRARAASKFYFAVWIHPKNGGDDREEVWTISSKDMPSATKFVKQSLKRRSEVTDDFKFIGTTQAEVDKYNREQDAKVESQIKKIDKLIEDRRAKQ